MEAVEALQGVLESDEAAVIGDGIAEDTEISEALSTAIDVVKTDTAELVDITEEDIADVTSDEAFNEEEASGTFDTAEDNADVSTEERNKLDTSKKAVKENNNKFVAFVKKLYTSMKTFITSKVGLACIEATGTAFKYYFIFDIVGETLTSVNEIVNGSSSTTTDDSYTDDQQTTADTLSSYISFLSSMYDIVSSVGDSLTSAATFGTGDDSDTTSAAYLAGNMTTNNFKSLMSVTDDALTASNTVLLNISSALTALGYSSDTDSDDFVKSIVYNPTLLTNSVDELDVDSIDAFKTAVTTYKTTTTDIISETYTDQTEIDTVTAFFYISDGWDTTADALESFVSSYQDTQDTDS